MKLPLWSLIPATALLTLTFFLGKHMNYSFQEWIVGNGIVALGILLIYGGEFIYNYKNGKKH